jgi:hypothetical protein
MLRGFKTGVWFVMLTLMASDHFFTTPRRGWWLIGLACLGIAIVMGTDGKDVI